MSRGPSRNPNTGTVLTDDVRSQYLMMAPPVVSKHVARKLCIGCVYFSVHGKLVRQTEVRNPYITSHSRACGSVVVKTLRY